MVHVKDDPFLLEFMGQGRVSTLHPLPPQPSCWKGYLVNVFIVHIWMYNLSVSELNHTVNGICSSCLVWLPSLLKGVEDKQFALEIG